MHVRRADDDEPDPATRALAVVLGRHVGEEPGAVDPGRAGRRKHHAIPDLGPPDPPGREGPGIVARHRSSRPVPPSRKAAKRPKPRNALAPTRRRVWSPPRGRVKEPNPRRHDPGPGGLEANFSTRGGGGRSLAGPSPTGARPILAPPTRDHRRLEYRAAPNERILTHSNASRLREGRGRGPETDAPRSIPRRSPLNERIDYRCKLLSIFFIPVHVRTSCSRPQRAGEPEPGGNSGSEWGLAIGQENHPGIVRIQISI